MPKKKPSPSKPQSKKASSQKKKVARRKKPALRGKRQGSSITRAGQQGLGSEAGGQSGDVQGLSRFADADSESVEELAEEGQAFEAELISGVEDAPDADVAEVRTKEVPEDDVPPEYLDKD